MHNIYPCYSDKKSDREEKSEDDRSAELITQKYFSVNEEEKNKQSFEAGVANIEIRGCLFDFSFVLLVIYRLFTCELFFSFKHSLTPIILGGRGGGMVYTMKNLVKSARVCTIIINNTALLRQISLFDTVMTKT